MSDPFRLGGWGMYPTAIAGLVLVLAAIQFARDPELRRKQLVHALSLLTMLVGTLGFITGVIKSFISTADVAPELAGHYAIVGVGESLNNVGVALAPLISAWAAGAIGIVRAARGGNALVDPQRPS